MTERSNEESPEGNDHDPPQWGTPGPAESTSPTSGSPARYGAQHTQREPGMAPQPPPTAPAPPGRQAPASYAGAADGRPGPRKPWNKLGVVALVLTLLGVLSAAQLHAYVLGFCILAAAFILSVGSLLRTNKERGTGLAACFLSALTGVYVFGSHLVEQIF